VADRSFATVATFAAMAAKATGFDPERFPFAIGLSSQIAGKLLTLITTTHLIRGS
jgi:hypothetical protein